MASFICTCRNITGTAKQDATGCVVHDRISRLQFERDEAIQDKERHKRHVDDIVGTMNEIAAVVDHRGNTLGDELVASVKRLAEDRDHTHKLWARLTGTDSGNRVIMECNHPGCHDRVSVCNHATASLDENRMQLIQAHNQLGMTEELLATSELKNSELAQKVAAPGQERLLLLYLERNIRNLMALPDAAKQRLLWDSVSATLQELTVMRDEK